MDRHHADAANAFGWKEAWAAYDPDDHPELAGVKFYDLPNGDRIYSGDRFFDTEDRYLIEVDSVRTQFYTGTVGPRGEEAGDCVFFERDWHPPVMPGGPNHRKETHFFQSVEGFAQALDDGKLVPHRGNGAPRIP